MNAFNEVVKLRVTVAVLVLVTLATSSCIHKVGSQPSPYERAVTYSTMLAQTNNSIGRGVIEVQTAGLITVKQAEPILHYQELIADDHQRLSAILNSGPEGAKASAETVKALIDSIQSNVTALVQSGGLGVKNPETRRTFDADARILGDFARSVVSNLQTAGVLP